MEKDFNSMKKYCQVIRVMAHTQVSVCRTQVHGRNNEGCKHKACFTSVGRLLPTWQPGDNLSTWKVPVVLILHTLCAHSVGEQP